jgi:hypothetical protein
MIKQTRVIIAIFRMTVDELADYEYGYNRGDLR